MVLTADARSRADPRKPLRRNRDTEPAASLGVNIESYSSP